MAKAGFFFWPKLESEDDTAVCVQCGLALDGWEPNDDPRYQPISSTDVNIIVGMSIRGEGRIVHFW